MKARYFVAVAALIAAAPFFSEAQNKAPEGYLIADSLVYTPVSAVDSTLSGQTVWSSMPVSVKVNESRDSHFAVTDQIDRNSRKTVTGYRIRIFFDNKQNSRGASEAALGRFKSLHPGISAYRSFSNPFFKVTVGDYRTRSEALAALQYIKPDFPTAFIVKEKIRYPALNANSFKIDTIKVLKPTAVFLHNEQ